METLKSYLAHFNVELDRMNDVLEDGALYLVMARLSIDISFWNEIEQYCCYNMSEFLRRLERFICK